jgi:hypothetical protein
MKLIAKTPYSWWTVGKEYEIVEIEYTEDGIWYQVVDDEGEKFDLHSEWNKDDFELTCLIPDLDNAFITPPFCEKRTLKLYFKNDTLK